MQPSIVQELKASIKRRGAPIPFAEFMGVALYHPAEGYYQRAKERVGFGETTDFFTASSTGAIFAELVVSACATLLGTDELAQHSFVEIGAEPGRGILPEQNPFRETVNFRRGEPLAIPARSVVFSNELFDAQPFHRLVFQEGEWREIGVDWQDGPTETLLPELSPEVKKVRDRLPQDSAEGYHLDLPLAAESLLDEILSTTDWGGLLIIFDYGKSWRELVEATPQGTARAYRRHRQSNDLLADPGDQDLTCHVCWDWLEDVTKRRNFRDVTLQSQEAFFVNHSRDAIGKIVSDRPGEFDPRRQNLHQLLHPGNMGQKFQVLHARRTLR